MSGNSKRPSVARDAEPFDDDGDGAYVHPDTGDHGPPRGYGPRHLPPPEPPLDPLISFGTAEDPEEPEGPIEQSGLFYADGRPIPAPHPDHGPIHLLPRRPDGGFAAYYYCSKEELEEWGLHNPPPLRHRHDGFTPERIAIFIRTLRATASVSDAARAAGISRKTAYDLYHRADAAHFRLAWDEALRAANVVLASTAFDRAVNGVEEAVWYKGEFRGWRNRHDNRLLMWLLRVRDPLNFAPLDDLQGWLRHRDVEPHAPLEPGLDRLAAAEEQWGRRLPDRPARLAAPPAGEDPAPDENPDAADDPAVGSTPEADPSSC